MKNIKSTNLLILGDDDMNCDTAEDISKMSLKHIGLSLLAIDKYDMVVYEGRKGSKILKSKYTKRGIIQ